MEVANAFWFCVTCSMLAYLSAVTMRRRELCLKSSKPGQRSNIADVASHGEELCLAVDSQQLGVSDSERLQVASPPVSPLPQLVSPSRVTPDICLRTHVDHSGASVQLYDSVHSRHTFDSPLPSACGSTACSVVDSIPSSRSCSSNSSSGSHTDSDADSADCSSHSKAAGRVGRECCSPEIQQYRRRRQPHEVVTTEPTSSCSSCWALQQGQQPAPAAAAASTPSSSSQTADAAHRRPLRPAIRLTPPASSSASSSSQSKTQPHRASPKSVTFKTDGAVICSPPTEEALGLLAAGAPSLPVRSPCKHQALPQLTLQAPPQPASCSSSSSSSVATPSPPPGAGHRTSASAVAAGRSPRAPSAVRFGPSGSGAAQPLRPQRSAEAGAAAAQEEARALELALSRAASGRRRVMAALEEARSRHAHLAMSSSSPAPAARAAKAAGGVGAETCTRPARGPDSSGCSLASAAGAGTSPGFCAPPAPHLPLASCDRSILRVGYAESLPSAPSPYESLSFCSSLASSRCGGGPSEQQQQPDLQQQQPKKKLLALPVSLRQVVSGSGSADRLRLAEALAKQSCLT